VAGRSRHLGEEILRFLAVGGAATVVALVGFNVLVHGFFEGPGPMHDHPIPAYVLANAVAGVLAYRGARNWAFRHREVRNPVGGPAAFFTIGAATMLIPVACLAVSRYLLHLTDPISDNVSANVVGLGLGTAARFWAFRAYVFHRRPHGDDARRDESVSDATDRSSRDPVRPAAP
jgi:putative flippase GtrA